MKAPPTRTNNRIVPTSTGLAKVSTEPLGSGAKNAVTKEGGAKSELTRAAEAKEAQRRVGEDVARKRIEMIGRQHRPHGSARRFTGNAFDAQSLPLGPIIGGVAVMAIVGVVAYAMFSGGPSRRAAPPGNSPPQMTYVALAETPAGIVARPDATDANRDRINYRMRWYVNEKLVSGAGTALLTSQNFAVGSRVEVEVTPEDPYQDGAPMLSKPLFVQGPGKK
jgi:hypothetical protein